MNLESVFIYLAVFGSSLLFLILANTCLTRKKVIVGIGPNRTIWSFFVTIAILIPCIFAAFRGLNVGRDVSTYIVPNFNFGYKSGMSFSYYSQKMPVETEFLFRALLYVCSKVGNIHLLFFVIELLILSTLVLAIVKMGGKKHLTISLALYYFLFFNFSLSGMRQSIAMSILLLATAYYLKKQYRMTFVLIVIAQLFHSSVLFIVLFIAICIYINKSKHRRILTAFFVSALLFALITFPIFGEHIALFFTKVKPTYGYYVRHYLHPGYNIGDVYFSDLLFKSLLILPVLLMIREKKLTKIDRTFIFLSLLGRYFVIFNGVFYEAMRIAFYFDIFVICYIPLALGKFKTKNNKICMIGSVLVFAFFYWIHFIMKIGAYNTNLITFNI